MGNVLKIKYNCVSNGEGIRTAVYFAGCNIHCPGCFNQEAWDFNSGTPLSENLTDILESIEKDYIDGLSILGGEPMDPKNQKQVFELIQEFRKKFKNYKNIWMWTGYEIDKNLPQTEFTAYILKEVDVIVDGPFKQQEFETGLYFKGSKNQRVLRK